MNKLLPYLVVSLFFLGLIPIGSSDVTVYTGTYYYVGNETYGVTQTMNFSYIQHNSTWIKFNDTDFNITSANDIDINLTFLHENFSAAGNGDEVIDINVNSTGNVDFEIGGCVVGQSYVIKRGGINYGTSTANAVGKINFSNSVWTEYHFEIFNGSLNTAPVAVDDTYSVDEAGFLAIDNISGVLTNDNDADGDSLTAVLSGDVAHGTLTLNSNGSFVYKAPVDFSGVATFTYYANDGSENSNLGIVYIHVVSASGTSDDNEMGCYQRVWTKDNVGQIVVVYSGGRIKRITGYDSIIVVGKDDISKFEDFLGIGNL